MNTRLQLPTGPLNDRPQGDVTDTPERQAARSGTTRRRLLTGIAAAPLFAQGCALGSRKPPEFTWKEEVLLADGRMITVTQWRATQQAYDGQYFSTIPRLGKLTFAMRETGGKEVTWSGAFQPLILNVHEGVVYLAGMPFTAREFEQYGRPRSGWIAQRLIAGPSWERIKPAEVPETLRTTNLVKAGAWGRVDSVKLLTWAEKDSERVNRSGLYSPEKDSLDPLRKSRGASGLADRDLTD